VETLEEPREEAAARWSPREVWSGLADWFTVHETKLWWLHSLWALAFGIGVMWLGARNFAYLRIAIIHVAFIWVTSMALPFIIRSGSLPKRWRNRAQLLINYFNKNFYQQLLFFILPVFWLSTTPGSRNVLFVVLLATAALLSTMDLIYDRHVAVRRVFTALFFSFSVFAGAAAALPILWQIETTHALWLAAVVAAIGATTLIVSERRIDWQRTWFAGGLIVVGLFLMVEHGRPFIPPAPLRIQTADFGTQMVMRDGPRITRKIGATPTDPRGQVYVVTAIYAPRGLHDRVRHVWYRGAQPLSRSRWYDVDGGRKEGYRLWTVLSLSPDVAGKPLHVDVETESGQLIGRAALGAAPRS
jgi:hypothetical protein